ncbi:hypothetical protein IRJ41_012264 [Triplophysa rosa]|uniref:Uncharacterized protein n=1 Tax=Triplophysa rosa TaxID=992332 RepID=A0A9W7W8G7_TRIRA|nr:hypothetical protein IRJ41_012264 [Triplophysa rosa]
MDQSGVYQIIGKGLQRTFRVNVKVIPEPVQSIDWMKIALWVAVLVLVIALVSVIMYYKRCCRRGLNKKEENETCERLNQQSFNTNGT